MNRRQTRQLRIITFLKGQTAHRFQGVRRFLRKLHISPNSGFNELRRKKVIFIIPIQSRYGTGHKRSYRSDDLFKKEFRNKYYVCLGRSSVIRLLFDACKPIRERYQQKALSEYLTKLLSEAERCAVLWHLGCRTFRDMKSSIQIDDVKFPRGEWSDVA